MAHALPVEETSPDADAVRHPVPVLRKSAEVEAVVLKRFVVVALVPVAFTKVKFWRVEEPLTRRFESVPRPPEKLPVVREVEKRLVLDAVVAKEAVEVALVPVAFTKVKF